MFLNRNSQYLSQALANLIRIDFHNIENGEVYNTQYNAGKTYDKNKGANAKTDPIHTIQAVLTSDFSVSLNSVWEMSAFPTSGISGLAGKIGNAVLGDKFMNVLKKGAEVSADYSKATGTHSQAFQAGPWSSQKYGGTQGGLKLGLKFTCYADAHEMLGFQASGKMSLSDPLEAFYWLTLSQLPKEGRGAAENIKEQAVGLVDGAVQGVADVGQAAVDMWNGKKQISNLEASDLDNYISKLNSSPGNWIARLEVGSYMAGWFVINSMNAKFSKQRVLKGNGTVPLYIEFDIGVTNYMVPDKASIMGSKSDIVKPRTGDNNEIQVSQFSQMHLENLSSTAASRSILGNAADATVFKSAPKGP